MAFVEILNFGSLPGNASAFPVILGRSSGIQQDEADEIINVCNLWGNPQETQGFHPAIVSLPLSTKSGSRATFAVMKIQFKEDLIFRVAVISQSDFAAFGYNPFALVEAGAFPEEHDAAVPVRIKLKANSEPMSFSPPPSSDDVGMVGEALHQLLVSHKLYLPLQSSTAQSDRCLALLVEVMPVALKQQLRFASFAPSPTNGYHLAAKATDGCEFSGWKRLMMSQVSGTLLENHAQYVKKVKECLAFGDLAVIREQSKLLSLNLQNPEIQKAPVRRTKGPVVAPLATTVFRPKSVQKTSIARGQKTVRPNEKRPQLGQMRGSRRQLPGAVVGVLVLALTLTAGWTYLEFIHGGGGIQWNNLVSWPGQVENDHNNRVTSLLEVPNVGDVYDRQIKKIQRAKMIPGLNEETDQRRGVTNLKTEAAIPLLQQVDLFLELSAAGIRQGSRPDREAERLKALAHQGHVLEVEMSRLELAWYSLSSGVNWKDLTHLSDSMIQGRRDSLARVAPSALKAAAADMEFASRLKKLGFGTAQMGGMSQLLVLFQESKYSKQWCVDLYRAAEMVSPSASTMTRAYRNSAFTLVRLKNAEHQDLFLTEAFVETLENGVWPDETVEDILPGLRKEIGKFNNNEAPPLLAGTLQLYQILENPMPLVAGLVSGKKTMEDLENNAAVQFDAGVYANYLQRIRYEAALEKPELYPVKQQAKLIEFETVRGMGGSEDQWLDQVARQNIPFLKHWAKYEMKEAEQTLFTGLSDFDMNWESIQVEKAKLERRVKAGHDWTAVWVDLNHLVEGGIQDGTNLVDQGPDIVSKHNAMKLMKKQMVQSHDLEFKQVTVRLNQDQLENQESVVFEFLTVPDGGVCRSEPFNIGPAAPAGSGWVGTVALATSVQLSPVQPFRGSIKAVDGGRKMLSVDYPSLSNRVGPGALARPRSGEEGSLQIKISDSWWRSLSMPEKEVVLPNS